MEKEKRDEQLAIDRKISKLQTEKRLLTKKYKNALEVIKEKEQEQNATQTTLIETKAIRPRKQKQNEATAFLVASDWHIEEVVRGYMVNGLNTYNPKIAEKRAMNFFRNGAELVRIMKKDTEIHTIVVALLGDFISSNIHDELKENNSMLPMDAIMFAQTLICSGIEYLLKQTDCDVIVQCHSGNHSRITRKIHHSTESGNSLEFFMYHNIRQHFATEQRVSFNIAKGYHSFLKVYGRQIRFHHGHAMRYGGGVGGIYIPVNKAIAQWNKMCPVALDVFAHFHQFRDGGNFICNGSLIGYNAFALSIKADYETPKQAFFLIDRKRWKTLVAPVFLD